MERTSTDTNVEGTERGAPPRAGRARTGLASSLLGCLCLVAAGAMVAAPQVLGARPWTLELLGRQGVTWPLLAVGGIVLCAIGGNARRLERAIERAAAVEPPAPAPDPVLAQITTDLGRLRTALHEMRVEAAHGRDALARLQQEVAMRTEDTGPRESETAIFRLAASIDQVGGRVMQGLWDQRAWWKEELERSLAAHRGAPRDEGDFEDDADPYASGFDGPAHEVEVVDGYVQNRDDLEVEVTLEDEVVWPSGLGLLDILDDDRTNARAAEPAAAPVTKTSPRLQPGAERRPEILAKELGKPSPALPRGGEAEADPLAEKLALLRDLLADPTVMRVIENEAR